MVRVVVGLLMAFAVAVGSADAAAPDEYIVVLRDGADPRAVAREHANQHAVGVEHVYEHALRGYAGRIPPQRLARVQADPRVRFVAPDRDVQAHAQSQPTGISRIGGSAEQRSANSGAGVGVAVLDTGVDLSHPDLQPVVNGKTCVKGTKNAADDNGHGTHVAGTIAARDNAIGVVGVAPAASIYAVKVLNRNGTGAWSGVICGIDWVTANASKIQVANMSLGSTGAATPSNADCTNSNNDALHMAICRSVKAGVTYVVSAGNSAADTGGFVPAAYEEAIAVSALADFDGAAGGGAPATCRADVDDTLADFSNFGATVDIAAPGVCIQSTTRGGGYGLNSGTSMAAPHVAGAAALQKASNPAATPADVRAALIAAQEPGPIAGDPDSSPEGVVRVG